MASTVWRGYISFGLISIPVRLFRAARAERVSLRKVYRPNATATSKDADETGENEEGSVTPARAGQPAAVQQPERRKGIVPAPDSEAAIIAPAAGAAGSGAVESSTAEPAWQPIRQAPVTRGDGQVLPERAVAKGYEYEKNRFVALEAEELKSIAPKTATEMQIEEFVKLSEVDPVYFETSYYVVPDDPGKKAYALLYRALATTGLVAVAQFAMHSREHVVVLRPGQRGLIAHTMFFENEVRADEEFRADVNAVTAKELQLAETLVHSLAGTFAPSKYRDTYREKLEELIAKKVAGQPVIETKIPQRETAVVDITEALQRSLAALKKPAAEQASTATPKRKAAGRRAS